MNQDFAAPILGATGRVGATMKCSRTMTPGRRAISNSNSSHQQSGLARGRFSVLLQLRRRFRIDPAGRITISCCLNPISLKTPQLLPQMP